MAARNSRVDAKTVHALAVLLSETGLTEIEIRHRDLHLRLARSGPAGKPSARASADRTIPVSQATSEPAAVSVPEPDVIVKAPLVGRVYLSLAPGSRPLVARNTSVRQGQIVALIEALGAMTDVLAPRGGTLTDILIADSQPVEYGEPLFVIS